MKALLGGDMLGMTGNVKATIIIIHKAKNKSNNSHITMAKAREQGKAGQGTSLMHLSQNE